MVESLETERVYKELGCPHQLLGFIDNPPKLLFQLDLKVKLFTPTSTPRNCRIYVFDRVFILALRKEESISKHLIWFADKNTKSAYNPTLAVGVNSNVGVDPKDMNEMKEIEEVARLEEARLAEEASDFSLCCYMDLSQTYPSMYTTKMSKESAIFFTNIARVDMDEEELIDSAVFVDSCELYFGEEDFDKVKVMIGHMSENVNAMFRADAGFGRGSLDQGDLNINRTNRNRSSRVMKTGTRKRVKSKEKTFPRGKKNSVTTANANIKKNMQDMRNKQKVHEKQGDGSESGEFGVIFARRMKGFGVIDGRGDDAGIFVSSVEKDSMAEAAGISVGDRLISADGVKITGKTDFSDILTKIDAKTSEKKEMLFLFSRTVDEEMKLRLQSKTMSESKSRSSREMKDEDIEDLVEKESLRKHFDNELSMSSLAGLSASDLHEEIVFRKRTKNRKKTNYSGNGDDIDSDFIVIADTKLRSKKVEMKSKVWDKMRRGVKIDVSKFAEQKKKQDIEDDAAYEEENTQKLFDVLLESVQSQKEKTCIYNLKEIYTTEVKYLEELELLMNAKTELSKMKKSIKCKELKHGTTFCEHFNVRRFCSQESRYKAPAIPEKDLDSVFLNVKSLINIHQNISGGLRRNMSEMMEKMDSKEMSGGIGELLRCYCSVYTTYCPFLTMYTQYIQRYAQAVTTHKTLKTENEYFNAGIVEIERQYKLTFVSLINKPLHRITKYPLFFTTLVGYVKKYISEELHAEFNASSDALVVNVNLEGKSSEEAKEVNKEKIEQFNKMFRNLTNAEKIVKDVVDKINIKVGEADNLQKMLKVYDEIGGPKKIPDLLQGWRRFKEQVQIAKFEIGNDFADEQEEPYIYLFNDIIVVAIPPAPINRRLSMASITSTSAGAAISAAAKAASQVFSATLRKGSKLNLMSSKKNSKPIDEDFLKSLSTRRERNVIQSRRFSGGSGKKSKANSSAQTKKGRTSGNDNEEKPLDLTPVATLQVNRLVREEFLEDMDMDDEPVYIVTYNYESNVGKSSFNVEKVKFHFSDEKGRDQFANSITEIKNDYVERRKGFEQAKALLLTGTGNSSSMMKLNSKTTKL